MFVSKSNLKDHIGILYYRHGLFCASNPTSCLFFVILVVLICCYPLKNLSSFSSSLEQYKQSISSFDGLEANAVIDENNVQYERLADRPAWYNRVPIAYIQRIVVRSIFKIPKAKSSDKLYLIDTFRTPIAQLFELNEFVRSFRTENHSSTSQKSLIADLCVHVNDIDSNKYYDKSYLPEFNCLYLSPANFWFNDFNLFNQDTDLLNTIHLDPFKMSSTSTNQDFQSQSNNILNQILSSFNANNILSKNKLTSLKDLLFGVSWQSNLMTSSNSNNNLNLSKLTSNDKVNNNNSLVFTYAITIALKKYDKSFLDELKLKLKQKFSFNIDENSANENDQEDLIVNLQYTKQSYVYYIPYLVLYFLLFLYIYISVRKIEFVKSKWGLAFAAVAQVIASLFMSIGICSFFGLTPTLNGGEIFPYLIIFIGFENIVVLTKSVVSTPFDLDVRYRIALGLKKESWLITKIITFELIIIFFGILTMVPAIQEFCVFAYVGLLIDFFMQMIFFVTVLSIDIRRMELTDLNRKSVLVQQEQSNTKITLGDEINNKNEIEINAKNVSDHSKLIFRGNSLVNGDASKLTRKSSKNKTEQKFIIYSNFFTNKSLQLFYFWARTRIVQRAIILLSVIWILLIFYKSLLVVELMRHDVDVRKETVEALLPKTNLNLPKLIKDNLNQFLSVTPSASQQAAVDMKPAKKSSPSLEEATAAISSTFKQQHDWQSLSYYHWLSLFSNYNVSLYNRYVAILPQINLHKLIKQSDIPKYRNKNEIAKHNSIFDNENFSSSNLNLDFNTVNNVTLKNMNEHNNVLLNSQYKSALFELIGIVIFGIPTIFFLVYFSIIFYRCLCSKNYELWRKTWSTSNIKKQYKIIHSKKNRNGTRSKLSDDETTENESNESDANNNNESYDDEMINKIINGKENEIDLEPYKLLNTKSENHHDYPIEIISCGSSRCATSDINNQIKVWPLLANDTENVRSLDFTSVCVWSMCISSDDKFLFIGFSSGHLRAIDLNSNQNYSYANNQAGITHVLQLNSINYKLHQNHILLKSLQLKVTDYFILVARVNGQIELIKLEVATTSIKLLNSIDLNKNSVQQNYCPITNLYYPKNGCCDYFLCNTCQNDFQINMIQIEKSNFISVKSRLNHPNNGSIITSMCAENDVAVTGTQNGLIYVWSLFSAKSKFKLNNLKPYRSYSQRNDESILKLELINDYLISLSSYPQLCFWNCRSGQLIKEFKFFTPSSMNDTESSSFLMKLFKSNNNNSNNTHKHSEYTFSKRNKTENVNTEDQPPCVPSMCLYSNRILITGGCSCVYFWDISNGELINKMNINKITRKTHMNKSGPSNYSSLLNYVKEIKVIDVSETNKKNLLLTDYADTIYLLKIPSSVIQQHPSSDKNNTSV